MKAGRDWFTNGPIQRVDSAKKPWQNVHAARWMEFYSFARSGLTIPSIIRPVPPNSHTIRNKSLKVFASVLRSGRRLSFRPFGIFPATEPKRGNPIHDFLIRACFETWCGRQHTKAWDQNLAHSFLNFSPGASNNLMPCFMRWTDFSTHCHQDHNTQ